MGEQPLFLDQVARAGHCDVVTFEQRLRVVREEAMHRTGGRAFQEEEASAKALGSSRFGLYQEYTL